MKKDGELNLLKKIGLYFLGNFSTKIIGTLLIPIYAIYVLPEELGEIDLQQNIASIVAPIIVIGIWEAILKFGLSKDDLSKKKVVNTTFFYVLMSGIVSFIVIYPMYIFFIDNTKLSLFYTLLIVTTPFVSVLQYYTRMYKKNSLFVSSSILASVVRFLLLLITIIFYKLGIYGLIISLLGSQIFLMIYLWIGLEMSKKLELGSFDVNLLKKMIKFSFPLAINLISLWFLSGFTRMYINFSHGSEANGIYTFGLQCSSIVAMLGQVVNMATLEETLASSKKEFPKKFETYTDTLINIFFDMSTLALPFISIFFLLISKSSFSESFIYVPILILNAIFVSVASNFNNVFQFNGKTKFVFVTTLISAIVNIVVAIILNILLGVKGIVIAQLIGSLSLFILRYFLIKKDVFYRLKMNQFIISLLLFIFSSVLSLKLNLKLSLVAVVVLTLVMIKKNKKIIAQVIFKLKNRIT
ncbi:polysaccharide biosynthesis C-terminal domain-containing protein [Vagococcus carniphilus]|uniref:oligosaccharide flippase family protein n=1 Tax=Vagococcus carniphilus TaxID=218144 RepID=UPI003BAA69EC